MKYDYNYERVDEMTLNANLEDVLYYSLEYETVEYSEHFYNILYAIVEKEKYLQNKYGYHSILIEKLGEKSIKRLEQMFFKKNGINNIDYLKELDKDYEKYFNQKSFNKKTWFTITTNKCVSYNGELYFSDELTGPITRDVSVNIRGDKIEGVKGEIFDYNDLDPKYIWVVNEEKKAKPFWKVFSKPIINKNYFMVDKETGEVLPCPLSVPSTPNHGNIPRRVLNFVLYPHENPLSYDIYNSDFEKMDSNVKYVNADYRKGYILVQHIGENKTHVMDGEYKQIGTITEEVINKFIGKCTLSSKEAVYNANDGVIAINTGERIVYYDYLNNSEIDSFRFFNFYPFYNPYCAYSDGLYNFIDKNGLHGYKDIDGNVIIPPKYGYSKLFLGNVAYVCDEKNNCFILDKNRVLYPFHDVAKEVFSGSYYALKRQINFSKLSRPDWFHRTYGFDLDFSKQMYLIMSHGDMANLIANELYVIDDETPIVEITFGNIEKVKEKK